MSYPITDIEGIEGEKAEILKSVRIRTTERLLEAARTVKGRKALAEKTGIPEKQLLCWANGADRMRIKGINKEYAELLQAAADAGVTPGRILVRHADDERGEVRRGARPTGRRAFEPSYFVATSRRYQRRIVSGVTMPATSARPRRPRAWPFRAKRRR